MKLRKFLPGVPALFPGIDLVAKWLPVPADYELLFKLVTMMVCILLITFAIRLSKRSSAIWCSVVGCVCLAAYIMLASIFLYSNPILYRPGDNSVVGLWLTDKAGQKLRESKMDIEALRQSYGPLEWTLLYSKASQMTAAGAMFAVYCGAFVFLTIGLSPASKQKIERKRKSGRPAVNTI